MERNLTEGKILRIILVFTLPFFASKLLQTLYGLADLYIIGQFCEVSEITAVSNGSQIMHMVTCVIIGLTMGSNVVISQAVGAADSELKNKAIGNTVTIFAIIALIMTAFLFLGADLMIRITLTPKEAIPGMRDYLIVCALGIPFIVAYNVISAMFRGLGDSRSPMYFVAIACVVNIILDLIFIGWLHMGAMGAALGTSLSQGVSVLISLIAIAKKKMITGVKGAHYKLKREAASPILKVGIPIAAQDAFIQLSFVAIMVFANRRGLNDAAAVGIVEKLIGILFLIPSSFGASISTICAQNVGARKHKRAKDTLYAAIAINALCGILMAVSFQFLAPWSVGLFTKEAAVIHSGAQYMRSYVVDCIIAGTHFMFSSYFCAYSRSGLSFFHNIISVLCARLPITYWASVTFADTLFPMGCGAPIGSTLSVIICVICFIWLQRRISADDPRELSEA